MNMKTIVLGIGIAGALLAGVVSLQDIEVPWAPKALVQNISDRVTTNAVNAAVRRKEALDGQLLQNKIEQGVYTRDGERVPDPYLQQEQMFKHQIEEQERALDALSKQ